MSINEEVEYIIEVMRKHEDDAVLVEQLQAMLNEATQRERKRQYAAYLISRK